MLKLEGREGVGLPFLPLICTLRFAYWLQEHRGDRERLRVNGEAVGIAVARGKALFMGTVRVAATPQG